MSFLFPEDRTLSERMLVTLHPLFCVVRRIFPKTMAPPDPAPPHPSAMLTEQNALYRFVFPRFFRRISFDETQIERLRETAKTGTLVFVMQRAGQLEYSYFNFLFQEKGLPPAQFANMLQLRRWMRPRDLWASFRAQQDEIARTGRPFDPIQAGTLPELIADGSSAFIALPPSALSDEVLFQTGPRRTFGMLIEAQRKSSRPVFVVPLDFLWSRRPEGSRRRISDILFGEVENPGHLRKAVLFWRNYKRHAQAVIGTPIALGDLIAQSPQQGNDALAEELRPKLLETFHTQRRTVTGPPIRPRSWFIHEVVSDDELDETLCRIALERGKSVDDVRTLALRYAREIAADVDHTAIELLDRALGTILRRLFDDVHIDREGLARAKDRFAAGPVIFVSNHRSHADSLVLSHIIYRNGMTVPHIAAGINMGFWPLGALFRRCGAYFIRRSFRDNPLYRAVLETYLKVLLKEGYSQEFFIEGGRSRSGKLGSPRMGLLSMLHRAAQRAHVDTLHFVPVSITYDRVIEQKSYVREQEGGTKERERVGHLFGLTRFLRRNQRYGSISIRFGQPVPAAHEGEVDREKLANVADDICHEINRETVATPLAVASAAILAECRRGITLGEFGRNSQLIIEALQQKGVQLAETLTTMPTTVMEDSVRELAGRRLIIRRLDAVEPYLAVENHRRIPLAFIRNGIAHFLVTLGVTALVLERRLAQEAAVRAEEVVNDFAECRRLLWHEFRFATRGTLANHVEKALAFFAQQKIIERTTEGTFTRNAAQSWGLGVFSSQVRPFLETLSIALYQSAVLFPAAIDERVLISDMQRTGEDLYRLGKIQCYDAIAKAGFISAIDVLVEQGVLIAEEPEAGKRRRNRYRPSGNTERIATFQEELQKHL